MTEPTEQPRVVVWKAIADFSQVQREAAKTVAAEKALDEENKKLSKSNKDLSVSQSSLARDTERSSSSVKEALDRLAQARQRVQKSIEANNAASAQEISSLGRVEKALNRVEAAKLQESSATQSLTAANTKLAQANQLVEDRTNKVARAQKAYEDTAARATATTTQLEAAERKLNTAKEQLNHAVVQEQNASLSLERAQLRLVKTQNDVAAAEANVAQQTAKAAQEAQSAAAKAEAAAQREAKAAQSRLAALDKERQKVLGLKSTLQSIVAAREQSAAATLREAETEDSHTNALDRALNSLRRMAAAKTAYTKLTKDEQVAVDKANAAAAQFSRARQNEAIQTGVVNNRIKDLAAARGSEQVALERVGETTARYNELVAQHGSSSDIAIHAEQEMVRAEIAHEEASIHTRNAVDNLEQSERRLGATHQAVAAAEDKLAARIRAADQEMRSASGGGNFFTGVLNKLSSAFSSGGAGAELLSAAMTGLKFGSIGIGVLALVQSISSLISALFALASAISPALGALAAIGPMAVTAASALGTIRLAFSGVGNALKAYAQQRKAAATSATKDANSDIANAEAIKNAEQSLSDAREQAGVTARNVADSIQKALKQEQDAQDAVRQSQINLTQARADAVKNIRDLQQAVIDAALAERGATLSLEDAKQQLIKTLNDPAATRLQREQAQLAVDQAQNQANAAVQGSKDAQQAATVAAQKGVEGSDTVIAAKKAETDAIYNLQQAQKNYNETIADGARENRKAQEAIARAVQNLADAQRKANTETGAAATAANNYKYALSRLTPAGRAFVEQLISMQGYLSKLKATAQNSLLPGLTADLKRLPVLFPVLNRAVALMGRSLAGLAKNATDLFVSPPWLSALDRLGKAGPSIIEPFGKAFLSLLDVFRAVTVAAIPLARTIGLATQAVAAHLDKVATAPDAYKRMQAFFAKSWNTVRLIGDILKNLAIAFYNMGRAASDSGRSMLLSIDAASKKFADWTKSVQGNHVLHDFFAGVESNARAVVGLLGSIGKAFLRAGASPGLKPIIDEIKNVLAPALHNLLATLNEGQVGKRLVDIIAGIVNILTRVFSNSSAFNTFLGFLQGFIRTIGWFVSQPGVAPIIGGIATALAGLAAIKFITAATGIGKITAALSKFLKLRGEAETAAAAGKALTFKQQLATSPIQAVTNLPRQQARKAAGRRAARNVQSPTQILAGTGSTAASSGGISKIGRLFGLGGGAAAGGAEAGGAGAAEGAAAGGPVGLIILGVVALIAILTVAYLKWKWFHDQVNKLIQGIGKVVSWLWTQVIKPSFDQIAAFFAKHSDGFRQLFDALKNAFNAVAQAFQHNGPAIHQVLTGVGDTIKLVAKIFVLAIEALILGLNDFAKTLAFIINNIAIPLFKVMVGGIQISAAIIEGIIKALAAIMVGTWKTIDLFFRTAFNIFKTLIATTFKVIYDILTGQWGKAWSDVKAGWLKIWGYLTNAWVDAKKIAGTAWSSVGKAITDAMAGVRKGLNSIWDGIKNDLVSAVNFITQNVLNKFIGGVNAVLKHLPGGFKIPSIPAINIPADVNIDLSKVGPGGRQPTSFAKGGVTPGYTPGKDVHHFYSPTGGELHLSGGEGILVPEAVKALGGASGIQAINSIASRGRVNMRASRNHFAVGGVLGDITSGISSGVDSAVSGLRNIAAWSSKEALDRVVAPLRALMNKVPSDFLRSLGQGSLSEIGTAVYNFIKAHQPQGNTKISGGQNSTVLDSNQLSNAQAIARIGKLMGGSARDIEIAYMTAMVESSMRNLANPNVPESMYLPHDGTGNDHDSVGLFQQRNSWGTAAQRLNPEETSRLFFNRELNIPGRLTLPMGNVAQAVQVSAFPDRYAAWQQWAMALYSNLFGALPTGAGRTPSSFAKGGIIQKFHLGGIVKDIGPGGSNLSIAALKLQSLTEAPKNRFWTSALTNAARARLAGVNAATDVTNLGAPPRTYVSLNPTDPRIPALTNWMAKAKPTTFDALWQNNPYARNPIFPLQAYAARPDLFLNRSWPAGYNPGPMVTAESVNYRSWVAKYRSDMGLAPTGGYWTSDMDAPSDHILAHALNMPHPADWPHPWSGPVTAVEQELAQQDRSNALNTEWYKDLQIIANWGFTALVDELLDKGVADGLAIARSAVQDKATAKQLNDAIIAGQSGFGGLSNSDQATILKAISIIASGTPTDNKGLRDVAGTLQVPEYSVVNFFDKMSAQLDALPNNITAKFRNDVSLFRQGLFYANTGAVVPGNGNSDTVPAMLTPGEGVLNKMAMRLLGYENFNKMNKGKVPQFFSSGGVVLSPQINPVPTLAPSALSTPAIAQPVKQVNTTGDTYITNINTEIQNATTDSAYEMNKMLQRKSSVGEFNLAAKIRKP